MSHRKERAEITQALADTLKKLRQHAGMTQADLADHLDMSFQQVQKYESGFNRVAAGSLPSISRLFDVSIAQLFEGVPDLIDQSDWSEQERADFTNCERLAIKIKGLSASKRHLVNAIVNELAKTEER